MLGSHFELIQQRAIAKCLNNNKRNQFNNSFRKAIITSERQIQRAPPLPAPLDLPLALYDRFSVLLLNWF